MLDKLEAVESRYETLASELGDPQVLADQERFQKTAKAHSELGEVVSEYRKYKGIVEEIQGADEILADSPDPEMEELVRSELATLQQQRDELEQRLKLMLIPKDPNDDRSVVVEIRAGTGGEEAALFAGDLFRMYCRYAERRRFKIEPMSENTTGIGGFKEVIFTVEGKGAYSRLKFESGTHRVQRVPETESSGRIHTSAATVAVLPEAEEVDVSIEPGDLRIDVYRSSGHGGQSVNTTDSAVRITHLPTGMVVTCQDEKSQLKNRNKAMKILRARLLDLAIQEQQSSITTERRNQVGSGDRSERIRTYNFPQGRLTDHRIGLTLYRLAEFLEGDLDEVIDSLTLADETEKLKDIETE